MTLTHDLLPRVTSRKNIFDLAKKQLAANRASGRYRLPDLLPVIGAVPARANTTAYSVGDRVTVGVWVLYCEKAGTSGGSAPTITREAPITDGTVIWIVWGYLGTVAFSNSLALEEGRLFASDGKLYRVTAAGTTHASNPGPTTAAAGTSGTVSYVYAGEQTLPIITSDVSAPSGCSSRAAAYAARTLLSGNYTNNRLQSVSHDGNAYSTNNGGGGYLAWSTDAPLWALVGYTIHNGIYVWIDGELAAWCYDSSGYNTKYLTLNASNLRRKMRDIRFDLSNANSHTYEIQAKATDTFTPYKPASPFKAVFMGDSYAEFYSSKCFANHIGDALGIEDFRVSGLGTTGIHYPGSYVNYVNRFTVDCIDHDPDLVIIQGTMNDQNGMPGYDEDAVAASLETLISRVQSETTRGRCIYITSWNIGPAVNANTAAINAACSAMAAAHGVPVVDWSSFVTDGGTIAAPDGAGSSDIIVGSDGVHPSLWGHRAHAQYLAPRLIEAMETLT